MNERIQSVLDGELPRSALSCAEAEQLAEVETLMAGVLRSIPTRALPDLAPSVLTEIEGLARTPASLPLKGSSLRRLREWLWSPRPLSIQWRPAYAFAFAVAVLATVSLRAGTSPAPIRPQVMVQFRLDAPQAQAVALAGNFTNWKPTHQLRRTANGVWTIVVPLNEGVHKYAFVVDGRTWQPDPLAQAVSDGFGGQNSQIAVLSPDVVMES